MSTLDRPLLLTGPPGSGKSTLALALARRLGVPCVDTDKLIAQRAGRTVQELFASEGERGFRALEGAVVRPCLEGGASVVALGGGALLERTLRHRALAEAHVLALRAPLETLLARVQSPGQGARPLLAHDAEGALRALLEARGEGYAEAHAALDATLAPEELCARALEVLRALCAHPRVLVPLGARSYPVVLAPLEHVAHFAGGAPQRVLVTDARVTRAQGARFGALGEHARVTLAGRGDRDKTLTNVRRIWDAALGLGLERGAVVLGVGGGVVTDLAGFAASTLLRGVDVVQAPTTLLAMVDAAVGGKTGFDHARGKNLLGSMHQPRAVVCDPATLETLPEAHRRAGLAEVVKAGAVTDAALLRGLENAATSLRKLTPEALAPWVLPAVAAKARVVANDEREAGARALLNFGHTVGHALELGSGYRLLHGDAVALGMRVALGVGCALGVTPAPLAARLTALCDALGLPAKCLVKIDTTRFLEALGVDKKRARGAWRFVLCTGEGQGTLLPVEPALVRAELGRLLEIRLPAEATIG